MKGGYTWFSYCDPAGTTLQQKTLKNSTIKPGGDHAVYETSEGFRCRVLGPQMAGNTSLRNSPRCVKGCYYLRSTPYQSYIILQYQTVRENEKEEKRGYILPGYRRRHPTDDQILRMQRPYQNNPFPNRCEAVLGFFSK
jgi:hypothetical protein